MQNQITFAGAIKKTFISWRNYRGVSTRGEYWFFMLFVFLLNLVTATIDELIAQGNITGSFITLTNLTALLLFVVQLPLLVRRFHDAGLSGWWLSAGVLPYLVALYKWPAINKFLQNPIFDPQFDSSKLSDAQTQAFALAALDAFGYILLAFSVVSIFQLVVTLLPSREAWRENRFAEKVNGEAVWGYQQVWGYQPVWGYTIDGKFVPAPKNAPVGAPSETPAEAPKSDDPSI
jgi:uncharacterized membrane protein YhaH (DUF805 family)